MKIGKQLKMIRQKKGLSQSKLAALSRVPRVTITRIELGSVDPRISTLVRLTRALDVDISELTKLE